MRSQDSRLEPSDQVVKVGEGRVDMEPVLLSSGQVAKGANILLDIFMGQLYIFLALKY